MDTSNCPEYAVKGVTQVDNGIGGFVETSVELFKIKGYLDLLSGDEKTTNNAFIEESTHIFITDFRKDINKNNWLEDINGNRYDITLVDDPVQLHHHLEIYLKFIGEKNVQG